ncbi:MAG: glycerol-3-phosphate dehydrogenase/oxidase [Saprospiraceae bacterium]|nr:glycerol-3-phosphate dehydrogenase/oxidase [Saprospiraceae bacterium]
MVDRLAFAVSSRDTLLQQAGDVEFDLLVIGGGITGAGIALDAVTRGLSVCLVEKHDFASGTSSKSTKLIHGGLRYLKQFEFGLVKEVGRERAILHQLAPHLVVPEKMVLPLIKGGSLGKTMTSIGLYIYDFLADVEGEDKRRMLDKDEVKEIEPLLPESTLLGGSIYAEYRTDDARLTIEVVKTAFRHGALLFNYLECREFLEEEETVRGIKCLDHLTGDNIILRAKNIVNAGGPWVDELRSKVEPISGKRLYLTKGVHLVVPRSKLPLRHAIYFDVPHDNRMIFAIPRLDITYIGTTDTYYEGDKDQIRVSHEDVNYLLGAVNQTFAIKTLQADDIVSSWAGLRPLIYEDGKSASEISRKDEIFEAKDGLLSIAGGKLTGYRKMAERIVDKVMERMHPDTAGQWPTRTESISLTEDSFQNYTECQAFIIKIKELCEQGGLDEIDARYLVHNYGKKAIDIYEDMARYAEYSPDIALIYAELDHARDFEMMATPLDYLMRRTGRIFFRPESIRLVEDHIFQYFADRYLYTPDQLYQQKLDWREAVRSITVFQ